MHIYIHTYPVPSGCTPASQATPFTLQHVTADDVTKAVKALTSSATTTRDQMSLKLLRLSLSAISHPLSLIFKMSIDSCTFPTDWKMGQIIPIHKKGKRSDLANYRPITLLPRLSKTMEYLVHQQLKNYLDGNKLLHATQLGFRSKHSCCTALLDISTTLSAAKNKGLSTAMAALDYSKTFDTINHSILLRKMKIINFDANALSWFDSYLTG